MAAKPPDPRPISEQMILDRLCELPPEAFDPTRLEPKKTRVLLLCSHCGDENPECSDDFPCPECLQECNVAEVLVALEDVRGGFDFLKRRRVQRYRNSDIERGTPNA